MESVTTKGKHHKVPGNYRDLAFSTPENANRAVEALKKRASPHVKFEVKEGVHDTMQGKKKVYRVWWSV